MKEAYRALHIMTGSLILALLPHVTWVNEIKTITLVCGMLALASIVVGGININDD